MGSCPPPEGLAEVGNLVVNRRPRSFRESHAAGYIDQPVSHGSSQELASPSGGDPTVLESTWVLGDRAPAGNTGIARLSALTQGCPDGGPDTVAPNGGVRSDLGTIVQDHGRSIGVLSHRCALGIDADVDAPRSVKKDSLEASSVNENRRSTEASIGCVDVGLDDALAIGRIDSPADFGASRIAHGASNAQSLTRGKCVWPQRECCTDFGNLTGSFHYRHLGPSLTEGHCARQPPKFLLRPQRLEMRMPKRSWGHSSLHRISLAARLGHHKILPGQGRRTTVPERRLPQVADYPRSPICRHFALDRVLAREKQGSTKLRSVFVLSVPDHRESPNVWLRGHPRVALTVGSVTSSPACVLRQAGSFRFA